MPCWYVKLKQTGTERACTRAAVCLHQRVLVPELLVDAPSTKKRARGLLGCEAHKPTLPKCASAAVFSLKTDIHICQALATLTKPKNKQDAMMCAHEDLGMHHS